MSFRLSEHLKEKIRENNIPGYKEKKEQALKLQEEEEKRSEEERIRKEGEVKALFDEFDTIYGKKRYKARVPQLLDFLKLKKNAIAFWENQHIRKIYDISSQVNFLFSIYTEEIGDVTYEQWMSRKISSPFNNNYVVNYEYLARITNAHLYNLALNLNTIFAFCEGTCYVTESKFMEDYGEGFSGEYVRAKYIKARKYGDLLDKNSYVSRLANSNREEIIYLLNPLFVTENHFIRLDAYDVWRKSRSKAIKDAWDEVSKKAPDMIKLLDELVRTRRIYLKEMEKSK